MCDSTAHLGHFISSTDKKSIVKSAKSGLWRSFNMCMSDFVKLSYAIKHARRKHFDIGGAKSFLNSTHVESIAII